MYSVDLAAISYLGKRFDVDLFVAQHKAGYLEEIGGKRYNLLQDISDLNGYDIVAFWGDFLTNPVYGNIDFASRDIRWGHSSTREEAFSRWCRLFALVGSDPDFQPISLGTNFQLDLARKKKLFAEPLSSISEKFSVIMPRDPFSVKNISRTFPFDKLNKIKQGMDCAFLLPKEIVEKEDHFSFFFGRSGIENEGEIVSRIEATTGLKGRKVRNWLRLPYEGAAEEFAKMRRQIASSRFLITDTYHVSVNGFSLDTPVIGVGRRCDFQHKTVGDFKKLILFDMLGQRDLYFEIDDGANALSVLPAIQQIFTEDGARLLYREDRFDLMNNMIKKFSDDIDFELRPR